MAEKPTIRIFISSPRDVSDERVMARDVINRLANQFRYVCDVQPILWEWEPIRAGKPFPDSLPKPSDADIVVVILWSRMGHPLPDDSRFLDEDGTPLTGTEWEFRDAYRALEKSGGERPDLLVYRKTQSATLTYRTDGPVDDVVRDMMEQTARLNRFLARYFQDSRGSFIGALREFEEIEDFESVLEEGLRKLLHTRLETLLGRQVRSDRWIDTGRGSPFLGLGSFEVEDAPVFFGRTRARHEVRNLLKDQIDRGCAAIAIVGSSGSGKSSLAKAGVLADLKKDGVIGSVAICRHVVMRPSDGANDLVGCLSRLLLQEALPELHATFDDPKALATALSQRPDDAIGATGEALESAVQAERLRPPKVARLALVVDQFEELMTVVEPAERERFLQTLDRLARSGLVWVIVTMREDFVQALNLDRVGMELFRHGTYMLKPPRSDEVSQIIRKPAEYSGLKFEADETTGRTLAAELEREAELDPYVLPLLEFTLERLYEHRSEQGMLRFADYHRMGGLAGAIAQRAEEATEGLAPNELADLDAILRGLITVSSPTAEPTAVWLDRNQIETNAARRGIIGNLLEGRLLTVGGQDGEPQIRLVHEALITHWDRLRAVARDSRFFLQERENLRMLAARYADRRDDSYLLTGPRLREAKGLLAEYGASLDDAPAGGGGAPMPVSTFIEQSSVRQAALEEQEALRTARHNRLLRIAVGALALLAVVAIGSTAYIFTLRVDALQQAEKAREAEREAESAKEFAQARADLHDEAFAKLKEAWEAAENGNPQAAHAALQALVRIGGDDRVPQAARGVLFAEVARTYRQGAAHARGDRRIALLSQAKENFGRAIDLVPSPLWQFELSTVLKALAETYVDIEVVEQAIDAYRASAMLMEQLWRRDPDNIEQPDEIRVMLTKVIGLAGKEFPEVGRQARAALETFMVRWRAAEPDRSDVAAEALVTRRVLIEFDIERGAIAEAANGVLEWIESFLRVTADPSLGHSEPFKTITYMDAVAENLRAAGQGAVAERLREVLAARVREFAEDETLRAALSEPVDLRDVAGFAAKLGELEAAMLMYRESAQSERREVAGMQEVEEKDLWLAALLAQRLGERNLAVRLIDQASGVSSVPYHDAEDVLDLTGTVGFERDAVAPYFLTRLGAVLPDGQAGGARVRSQESEEVEPSPPTRPSEDDQVGAAMRAIASDLVGRLSDAQISRLEVDLRNGVDIDNALQRAFRLKNPERRRLVREHLCESLPSQC